MKILNVASQLPDENSLLISDRDLTAILTINSGKRLFGSTIEKTTRTQSSRVELFDLQ